MSSSGGGTTDSHKSLSDTKGPIDRLFPTLNGILAIVVTIGAFVNNSQDSREILESLVGYFPLMVYILSMIVRYAMTPLDLRELERMKYKYKGA